jgi:membrane associated rhomboid family serine protease
MLWSVVGANTFIFVLWHAVDPRFMQANFTVSERSVYTGSVHTLVTAAFSHYDFMHYASNMLALYYFGRDVGAMMGGAFLLNLYLAGGVVASATHVLWCRHERQKRRRRFRGGSNDGGILQSAGRWMENRGIGDGFDSAWRRTPPALGASGAVNAVVFLNAALFPMRTIYLNFFIPMPNILFAGMFLARDLYGAQMGLGGSGTGHAAHLGGAAVGRRRVGGDARRRLPARRLSRGRTIRRVATFGGSRVLENVSLSDERGLSCRSYRAEKIEPQEIVR